MRPVAFFATSNLWVELRHLSFRVGLDSSHPAGDGGFFLRALRICFWWKFRWTFSSSSEIWDLHISVLSISIPFQDLWSLCFRKTPRVSKQRRSLFEATPVGRDSSTSAVSCRNVSHRKRTPILPTLSQSWYTGLSWTNNPANVTKRRFGNLNLDVKGFLFKFPETKSGSAPYGWSHDSGEVIYILLY